MVFTKYFPLGLAQGEAFCNRQLEREKLVQNFKQCQHTLVLSPRRYGKSSLVLYALEESGFPYTHIDLFVTVNTAMLADQVLKGVKSLINKMMSTPQQLVNNLKDALKKLKSKWIIGIDGVSIELIPDKETDPMLKIMESLQVLEGLLKKHRMRAIFFIDEFQEIAVLSDTRSIEGVLRHVAQASQYLCFVFSGSNRRMLSTLFEDRTRPLYALCDQIRLTRIATEHYMNHLRKAAQFRWRSPLDKEIPELLFALTEQHPYYFNLLCHTLWSRYDAPPTKTEVQQIWFSLIEQEKSRIVRELSEVGLLQKKLLIAISQGNTEHFSAKQKLQKLDTTSASVLKALHALEDKDFIYKTSEGKYGIVDPLMKSSLKGVLSIL